MDECIFCKIIDKQAPARIFYEDKRIIAFEPLNKVSKGHTLVVPKRHSKDIYDIPEGYLEKLVVVSKRLSLELSKENKATGINLLNANGKDAQQSVFHFHLHLIPRYPNDGLDLWVKNKL
jgi:histidine triad (HIT) family protein